MFLSSTKIHMVKNKQKLTKSSETLCFKSSCILSSVFICWRKIVTNWMSLGVSLCCLECIAFGEQILTIHSFNMSSISWDFLTPYHVIWTTCPVSCFFWFITVHYLVLVECGPETIAIDPIGMIRRTNDINRVLTFIFKDICLSHALAFTKAFVFAGNMTCIASHELFVETGWSCKCGHL